MWIKRQVIKLKVVRMKREELSTKPREATRNEKPRNRFSALLRFSFRVFSRDFVERSLLFFALALVTFSLASINIRAQQTTPTPAPPTTSPQTPPAGTSTQQ